MIINNTLIHSHQLVSILNGADTLSEMPEKTYRIKFNGKFIRLKGKSEWDKIGNAKNSFKAFLRRTTHIINPLVNQVTSYNSSNYYYCHKDDINSIYNQLIADNALEFVEITN
jgi:hypothetical protein